MTSVTHDAPAVRTSRTPVMGLGLALVSAVTFALSGPLARPLLDNGWTATAVVMLRIAIGALVVLPFGVRALAGRWHLLRANAGIVTIYGVFAVAGAQFCYFSAVRTMDVGAALLIEYTAPAAVVAWLWLRHGQRPSWVTGVGILVAAVGLLLVLDVLGGSGFNLGGTLWALGAMVGASVYFVVGGKGDTGLPPLTLAAAGLVVGGAALALLALVGLLPMATDAAAVGYASVELPAWVAIVLLGVVTAAIPYVSGIAAIRRLGPRLASFVALSEVVAAVLWAWLLLGQLPGAVQLLGGLLILLGVIGVQAGEARVVTEIELPVDEQGARLA